MDTWAWAFLFLLSSFPAARGQETHRLFTLTRSVNKNTLVYEARMKGKLIDAADPILVYWDMQEKGGKREELTKMERKKVYGVQVESAQADAVVFSLKAFPERKVSVRLREARPVAFATLDGRECQLQKVHIQLKERGAISMPWIEVVEMHGVSAPGGKTVVEVNKVKSGLRRGTYP